MMNAQLVTRIDTLLRTGKELVHEGGSEFSGYNAKKQGKYLLWRKNCLDALEELKDAGAALSARIAEDENGLYFYHSSAEHIVTVMQEARRAARAAVEAEEERAKAEAAAREAEERERARLQAEALEREKREEARLAEEARKEAERAEQARLMEDARKEAEERERLQREADVRDHAREQEARESARKQVEALEAERTREEAANAAREETIAQTRAESESPASKQSAAEAPSPSQAAAPAAPATPAAGAQPKILIYSLSNHVMLKPVMRFFDGLSLEYSVITHTDGKWNTLAALNDGASYYAVFLLSDRYHGQELMALGYLAGSSPMVRLCAIHAHTLMLGELLPGVSKNEFTVSFDEVKPNLINDLKSAGFRIA